MADDLLLLSNSTLHGRGFLEHALDPVRDFLDGRDTVHFAPWALADHDAYTATVARALAPLGVRVVGLHQADDVPVAIQDADVLFVGGGNSFRLLQSLQRLQVMEPVRERVRSGALSYMGSSAGTNHACPTIRTTNDMPIVAPDGLAAFGLVPFQINPHYQDPPTDSTHMGETREKRILEFLEENDVPVVGIREGTWLRRRGAVLTFQGAAGGVVFRRGREPETLTDGADVSPLLEASVRFDTRSAAF